MTERQSNPTHPPAVLVRPGIRFNHFPSSSGGTTLPYLANIGFLHHRYFSVPPPPPLLVQDLTGQLLKALRACRAVLMPTLALTSSAQYWEGSRAASAASGLGSPIPVTYFRTAPFSFPIPTIPGALDGEGDVQLPPPPLSCPPSDGVFKQKQCSTRAPLSALQVPISVLRIQKSRVRLPPLTLPYFSITDSEPGMPGISA